MNDGTFSQRLAIVEGKVDGLIDALRISTKAEIEIAEQTKFSNYSFWHGLVVGWVGALIGGLAAKFLS